MRFRVGLISTTVVVVATAAIAIAAWEREVDIGELNRRLRLGPDADTAVAPSASAPQIQEF